MSVIQTREITPAERLEKLRYAIRDLACLADDLVRQGKKVLCLNIGDPNAFDFATPAHIVEAVYRAMRENKNGYAPSLGVEVAREAIRREAARKGISTVEDVFVTNGASEAVDICLTALLNPGESVLTPSPEYPLYSAILAKTGARTSSYHLNEEDGWQPDLEDMRRQIDSRTRALVLINPNNPTGSICTRPMLEQIAELARRHNLLIIADEIYDKLILDDSEHLSLAAVAGDVPVLTLGGLSKNYLAPGWRIGWVVVSGDPVALKPYLASAHKLLRARLSANHPEQYAIPAALDGPQDFLAEVILKLRARRDLILRACQSIPGFHCVPPRGAFYAFPRIEVPEADEVFVKELLVEKQILVVHGAGFGQKPGSKHFRAVFLPPEETLRQAFAGIADFVRQRYTQRA
ncbi:MAG: aminotransferase class I/II-fold pyridoxal phosphate-dependent enzyme [Acidobacteria bacterium]|nr:aminotransferase class I/II-fold pyridoxal phosphate-dependent enzyme [Acidobacteriota bacterium]